MAFNKNVCTSLDAVQCNGTMQPAEEGYLLFKKPDVSRDEKDPSHNTKLHNTVVYDNHVLQMLYSYTTFRNHSSKDLDQ